MLRTLAVVWALALIAIGPGQSLAEESVRADRHPLARPDANRSNARAGDASSGFWLSMTGVGVALAAFGAFSLLARKTRANHSESAGLRVVGRASLSPRQAVYLLRVGERTLIIGTGAQGAPSLLGELAPTSAGEPASAPPRPRVVGLDQERRIGGAA